MTSSSCLDMVIGEKKTQSGDFFSVAEHEHDQNKFH